MFPPYCPIAKVGYFLQSSFNDVDLYQFKHFTDAIDSKDQVSVSKRVGMNTSTPKRSFYVTLILLMVIVWPFSVANAGIEIQPKQASYAAGEPLVISYAYRADKTLRGISFRAGIEGTEVLLERKFSSRKGSLRTLRFRWTPPSPGRYRLYFEIDPSNSLGLRHRVMRTLVVGGAQTDKARTVVAPVVPQLNKPVPRVRPDVKRRAAPQQTIKPIRATPMGMPGSITSGQNQNCTPDLRVDRVEIVPPHPRAHQDYRIRIWVLQFLPNGVSQAPQAFVAVRRAGHSSAIDSRYVQFANNNSMVNPDFEWTRKDWNANKLEVYVRLDHLDALQECNEANNEFVFPYTVYSADQPMAELAVQGHMSFDTANLVNRNVNISGTIRNRGNASAGPFWVEFVCDDDRSAGTKFTHRVRINQATSGGGAVSLNTQMKWNTPGMKVCIMTVDAEDEVVESAEGNNEYIGITIHVDEQPPVR